VIKDVLLLGNPILRTKSSLVTDFSLNNLLTDLKDTLIFLQKTKNTGMALSAKQIGNSSSVIYFQALNEFYAKKFEMNESYFMINPRILNESKEIIYDWETCFSFDAAFYVFIPRPVSITVQYENERNESLINEFKNNYARLITHEIDHLNGKLAIDYLTGFDNLIMKCERDRLRHN
jgi:peptide deformylase